MCQDQSQQTCSGPSFCSVLIGSHSTLVPHEPGLFLPELILFDVHCDVWQDTSSANSSLFLISDTSYMPCCQHLSGHVLTINYSSAGRKVKLRRTGWCQIQSICHWSQVKHVQSKWTAGCCSCLSLLRAAGAENKFEQEFMAVVMNKSNVLSEPYFM